MNDSRLWNELGQKTVLVADDDSFNRQLISSIFSKLSTIKIVEAADGQEALDKLDSEPIDMIFLDIHMPIMNGFETLKAIKTDPKYSHLYIVVITTDSEEKKKALSMGADDMIVKPFVIKSFLSKVYKGLKDRGYTSQVEITKNDKKSVQNSILDEENDKLYDAEEIENAQKSYFKKLMFLKNQNSNDINVVPIVAYAIGLRLGFSKREASNLYHSVLIKNIGVSLFCDEKDKDYKFKDTDKIRYNEYIFLGATLLENLIKTGFVSMAYRMIMEQKEHYDGCGAPKNLKSNQISKYAYIASAAEVLNALVMPREYRNNRSYTESEIVDIFEQDSGKKHHPVVVKVILKNLKYFMAVIEKTRKGEIGSPQ